MTDPGFSGLVVTDALGGLPLAFALDRWRVALVAARDRQAVVHVIGDAASMLLVTSVQAALTRQGIRAQAHEDGPAVPAIWLEDDDVVLVCSRTGASDALLELLRVATALGVFVVTWTSGPVDAELRALGALHVFGPECEAIDAALVAWVAAT